RLPIIQGLDARAYLPDVHPAAPAPDRGQGDLGQVSKGNRDAFVYPHVARICKSVYLAGGSMEAALAEAMARNAELPTPHEKPEAWVTSKVKYWWGKTLANENRFGAEHQPRVRGWRQHLSGSDPVLYSFIAWLEEENGPDSEFWIAN